MYQDPYFPQQAKYPPLPPQPATTNGGFDQQMMYNGYNQQQQFGSQSQMCQQQQQYQQQQLSNQPQIDQKQNGYNQQYYQQPQSYQPQMYQQQEYNNQTQLQQQQQQQGNQLSAKQICAKASEPVQVVCPKCNKLVVTDIKYQRAPGLIGLATATLTLGTVKAVKDKFHSCPNCNEDLGVCKFIESKNSKKRRW
ncbi:LITAF-like zinc ribbon domain protein (macronuclear) [Tetrahymena thermophila SB210]|uniref:LITAF-like zinc ribbon domain protein n=1 Tax=Tetrahymena thermophila (strain SB210) TaxID=312017 RepID=Q22SR9_TETTS|nr:LITAF-like zinc ribbon domain protein [Tetrahymena thermophila SB210]EAR88306.1 LITAF-like zinc ribbon domain protein [Tetrahymena thermophila SB210]|eukprot:XP_001008551.1 LITAF-like zinc ribbon domain protein [Tetrahymena thermophila SB210]